MNSGQDCRRFVPDVPCSLQKARGVACPCEEKKPFSETVLIIKLAALGDVLRTTAILEPLAKRYPDAKIVWFTLERCKDVLEGNQFIDEIWTEGYGHLCALSFFRFDILINLDLSFDALALAGATRARKKLGFWYDSKGIIHCSGGAAREWFILSHDDERKRLNRKTYQDYIAHIAELPTCGHILVHLNEDSKRLAALFAERNHLSGKKVLGVNPGSGSRWLTKRWPEQHYVKLFKMLGERCAIILLGGREEKDLLARLARKSRGQIISAGSDRSVQDFFALLNLCDVVLTGDTLALHAALGLGKRVVALFGPTSSAEIEMYGHGEKISTPLTCACCYLRHCDRKPFCMDEITPEIVAQAVIRALNET